MCCRYKVNTNTNHSNFAYGEFSVLRRFSDFVWLHDQLCFFHPGCIVPPLPEKQTIGRFTPEFIDARRRSLEKFMSRVTRHKELMNANVLITFLQADDAGLNAAKEKNKQEKEKNSPGMLNWFESKVNALTNSKDQVFYFPIDRYNVKQ